MNVAAVHQETKALVDKTAFVHAFACVADSAVGARTQVWQFASVIRGAVVGEDCVIASGTMVDGSRVGDRSHISPGVEMGPGYIIGPDVFIGPNATFCNDRWPRADKTGLGLWVPAIAWASSELSRAHMAIVVERGATIGANAVILPGVVLGQYCMIAAGAVVERDVPPRHLLSRDGTLKEISDDDEASHLLGRVRLAARSV